MFINCPYCRALVATDPATDLPPPHCPQCEGPLRERPSSVADANEPSNALAPIAESTAESAAETHLAQTGLGQTGEVTSNADDDAQSEYASMPDDLASISTSATPNASADASTEASMDVEDSEDPAQDDSVRETDDIEHDATSDDGRDVPADILESPSPTDAPVAAAMAASRSTPRRRAGQTAPSFARAAMREDTTASSGRRWPAILAIAALSATLVLQMLLADRARLATSARWRPLLETLCGALTCDLPPWREPDAFALLQRDVRQHPTLRGALRVTASFRNDARWPQPWPKLHVTLSDVNGRPAGERSFEAREYLGGPPAQTMLGSGETATVAMDVLEPAAQIVSYDMRFR